MTQDPSLDENMIEMLKQALEKAREEFSEVEERYIKLKTQIHAYESSLNNLTAVKEGRTDLTEDGELPRRRTNQELKDVVYEYFASRPRFSQSPKGLTQHLVKQGWAEKGLNLRVSNLMRKIVKEESWLAKANHGKYTFVPQH